MVGIKQVQDSSVQLRTVDHFEVKAWGLEPFKWSLSEDDEEANSVHASQKRTKEGDKKREEIEEVEVIKNRNLFNWLSKNSVQSMFLAVSAYKDRHILIGDIHGQKKELQDLLLKLKFNKERDNLIVLGDFISKGPDSYGVVDKLIDAGAKCVMGNHEYYVLQYYAQYHGLDHPHFLNNKKNHKSLPAAGIERDPEFRLARKLKPRQAEFINSCSVIYKLGKVPVHSKKTDSSYTTGDGVAVHAGLRWDLTDDLEEQNPLECLQMRSYVGPHYNKTTDDPSDKNAVSWSRIWNQKHKDETLKDKYVVYYGHDARRGLKLKKWSKGLDSGCVKGDYLAAMVTWKEKTKKGPIYREQVVRVRCNEN